MNGSSVLSRRPRSTAAERARWVRRFFQSGLSPREFALQHGLSLWALRRWLTRHSASSSAAAETAAPTFAEVKLSAVASPPRWGAELLRHDGSTLRLAHDVPAPLIRQLLRAW